MWKTALFLLVAAVTLTVLAFFMEEPLTGAQSKVLRSLSDIYLISAGVCFIVSTLTRNYSQVDKLWSIMPVVYTWVVAVASGMEPRVVLMALMASVWGIRLSYNFYRRGGYSWKIWSGVEDYRWSVLRSTHGLHTPWKWALFNLAFISFYQMGIILLITLPALRCMGGDRLAAADFILAGLAIVFLAIETVADQQQWNYHRQRRLHMDKGGVLPEPYRKGFVDSGLWSLVRHPNYASEQAIWILFYFFSVVATGKWLNWSVTGVLLLVLLFMGSSSFSESISSGKYPEYSAYRKKVPRFIPFVKKPGP